MRRFERMIEGVGFYFDSREGGLATLPNYDECREMVRELAYLKWKEAGSPSGQDWRFWLEAEHELFCGLDENGYDVYICDLAKPENQRFFRHWDAVRITPQGLDKPTTRPTRFSPN